MEQETALPLFTLKQETTGFMVATHCSTQRIDHSITIVTSPDLSALLKGEILLTTQPHTAWGAAVTAQMYVPIAREQAWQQLTTYSRWVEFFPALTQSQVIAGTQRTSSLGRHQHLRQVARKDFWLFTAQAEVELEVIERPDYRAQFSLRSGCFQDFAADLKLQALAEGTWLRYSVQATLVMPIPSVFIQQAIQLDLPNNLRQMRQILCQTVAK